MPEKEKLVTRKRVMVATAVAGVLIAGYSCGNGDSEPRKEYRPSPGADTAATLRPGVTLRNEPEDPQAVCGATRGEQQVAILGEAEGTGDQRWVRIAPLAGELSVRRAPGVVPCISEPWVNATGLKPLQ